MEYSPRRIIGMIRAGFKGEVLTSYSTWLCASCFACTVECPKEIKITDIMYAVKQQAIREHVYKKRFAIPVLAREFYNQVLQYGRTTEGLLVLKEGMKTNPFGMIKFTSLGLRLLFTGRLSFKLERLKSLPGGKGDLNTIMKALDKPPVTNATGRVA